MIHRNRIVMAFAIALLMAGALAAEDPPPAATAPATAPDAAQSDLREPAELTALDKPNDAGTAILLTWKKMPYEAPDVYYEVMMADDGPSIKERLEGLVNLEVITPERRDALVREFGPDADKRRIFASQATLTSAMPETGTLAFPLCRLKTDFPGAFGHPAGHTEWGGTCPCKGCSYHAVELAKYSRKDLVLDIDRNKNRSLVKEIEKRRLVQGNHVNDVKSPKPTKVALAAVSDPPERDRPYFFKVNTIRGQQRTPGSTVVSATPRSNWFAWHKVNLLVAMLVLSVIIMTVARIAKRNPTKLFIRRIGGLEAVDEALGRAAEMGKPVFFCHGPGDLSSVVTISAINLLGKVAERVAEYGIDMKVTCLDYYVMQVSQEMVRDGYTRVGRPDAYRDENVMFVTADTFAYSAAVGGMMIREQAGTAFFFGRFGSEALLLSETGAITKAIQIAGTDSFSQIPFFITTCDYTLIAEEMYAASAYLSREPRLVGAVKGQDVVKAGIMTLLVAGVILASTGVVWFARLFWPLT